MHDSSDIQELLSLQSVRIRSHKVLEAARRGALNHFDYDESQMPKVATYVANVIARDFGPNSYDQIPPHGRWQQFNVGNQDRIGRLLDQWTSEGCDVLERARRMIDLLFVSVLLDAGAGTTWKFYESETNQTWGRSEGIALATLNMFVSGKLQAGAAQHTVNAKGLSSLNETQMKEAFQISESNSMPGFTSRVALLNSVGTSLSNTEHILGPEGRPGSIVDYLLATARTPTELDYNSLWTILQTILLPCWPESRTHVGGKPVGDAWPLKVLEQASRRGSLPSDSIQPFHKLTQWIGYSLRVPFTRLLGITWINADLSTALAEYRNGGIFVDIPVLKLKSETLSKNEAFSEHGLPEFADTSDEIVEWRAMTVALTDILRPLVSAKLGFQLSLSQLLEAGTFKAGRQLAAEFRPETKSSPILVSGDGTLF